MPQIKPYKRDLRPGMKYTTSRSGGAGGQHVNKVETKVTLNFDVENTDLLSEEEKIILRKKLNRYINKEGILVISAEKHRTQLKNREEVVEKFYRLLKKAFSPVKKRKPTKPTRASKEKRIKDKKNISEKKKLRKNPR